MPYNTFNRDGIVDDCNLVSQVPAEFFFFSIFSTFSRFITLQRHVKTKIFSTTVMTLKDKFGNRETCQ